MTSGNVPAAEKPRSNSIIEKLLPSAARQFPPPRFGVQSIADWFPSRYRQSENVGKLEASTLTADLSGDPATPTNCRDIFGSLTSSGSIDVSLAGIRCVDLLVGADLRVVVLK